MGESDPGSSGEHGKAKAGSEHSVGFCHCVLLKRRGQSRDLLSWEKKKSGQDTPQAGVTPALVKKVLMRAIRPHWPYSASAGAMERNRKGRVCWGGKLQPRRCFGVEGTSGCADP